MAPSEDAAEGNNYSKQKAMNEVGGTNGGSGLV